VAIRVARRFSSNSRYRSIDDSLFLPMDALERSGDRASSIEVDAGSRLTRQS